MEEILYMSTPVGEDLKPIMMANGCFFDMASYRRPERGDLVQIDEVPYEIICFYFENNRWGESVGTPVLRRYHPNAEGAKGSGTSAP